MKRTTGHYEHTATGGESVRAFVPAALPPSAPPVAIVGKLANRLQAAEHAIHRLDVAADIVPSHQWFLHGFVRKEAVISSQIEGTRASLVDLLRHESAGLAAPNADIEEISNYVAALEFARAQMNAPRGLPLSMRLLNASHERLMQGVRGANTQPGTVRLSQNWVGGSRPGNAVFVPPPPHMIGDLLGALEHYIHADDELPPLVRAGLVHVQFETIHPYLDGNGRIGRLLITLLLEHWNVLRTPVLYLSLFFKRHREEYYRRLGAVRTDGDWEGWLDYFLGGVATIADEAVESARHLFTLVNTDRVKILGGVNPSIAAARLFEALPSQPIVTVATTMRLLSASKPTAGRAVEALVDAGVLVETTGKRRDRWFAYQAYMDILRVGTDLESGT